VTEGLTAPAMSRFLAFFPGLEAPPSAATPQALRASSPSRGAFGFRGFLTHNHLDKFQFTIS